MQFCTRLDRARWCVSAAALLLALLGPTALHAAPGLSAPPVIAAGTLESVSLTNDGSLRLTDDATPAPPAYGEFARFGQAIMPPTRAPSAFRALRLQYESTIPDGAALLVDLRSSPDGMRWSEWELDLTSGAVAIFERPALFAQYRVTLLAQHGTPTFGAASIAPAAAPGGFRALSDAPPIAPTFTIRGTRQGMIGGRTANGHRIVKRDHFVSLPCRCALSSKGGSEYQVRITYRGRTSVAPVYDVGPWNTRDNYWDPQSDRFFDDLRQGWPQDHAAYYDGHNDGRAGKGRVRFPTAIDIGDGAWWDDLGIRGDQAELEVTFLWMGVDPLAAEQPAVDVPAAPAPAEGHPAAAPAPAETPAIDPAAAPPPAPVPAPADGAAPAPPSPDPTTLTSDA